MVLVGVSALSTHAHAQDPDVRSLTPVVMLVLDTSGSMEGIPGCSCPGNPDSNLCDECYPACGGAPGTDERNRWTLAVEALSGTFTNFSCTSLDRDDPLFTYDFGYVAPHHALPPPVITCTPPLGPECSTGILGALGLGLCLPLLNTCQGGSNQNDDGVLDAYLNDVRFGLMTFDTVGTYTGASQLIPDYEFSDVRSESVDGMFSYGGPQDFTYPNCINTYRMDTGVRSPTATEGRLISAGTDSSNWQAINATIQSELRTIRPFGGTPIAASLRDLDYYFRNHPDMTTDAYSACRGRYGVLITDGKPDSDFRQFGCDQPGFQCPYQLPEDEAGILRCGPSDPNCSGGGSGSVSKLFVIGLDVTDPSTRADLNLIAQRGGNQPDMVTGDYALFASDGATMVSALAEILDDTQPFPISRTTPLTVRSIRNISYRITTAFERPGGGLPWNGLLERQQLGCGTSPDAPLTPADRFHETLNSNGQRVLFSALPIIGSYTPNETMVSGASTDACVTSGCNLSTFDSVCPFCSGPPINNVHTVTADATQFGVLANWVHGRAGSGRELIKLGGIYHSSPVFVDRPKTDISDSSLSIQANSGPLSTRPDVIYVGSNDGILHAFRLEDGPGGEPAGQEMWGFIPPMLLDKLNAARTSPQIMLDGTPVAKNMFFSRLPGADASGGEYHTVLVSGMRQGGRGYFALDVTNPEEPRFLWQIAEGNMGFTYGRPALAQVTANFAGRLPTTELAIGTTQQRAIALLPGGTGVPMPGACNSARDSGGNPYSTYLDASATPAVGPTHRLQHRCWGNQGRVLYFVDVKTGQVIHKDFDETVFPSPLVGTPAVFNGAEGTIATRAFVTDADGVIWRIDFSDPEPANWRAIPFHDLAWGFGPDAGEPAFEPPLLSIDEQGRVVVIYAQGNLDNFENPSALNRVVSLTEVDSNPADPAPETIKAGFNWEHNLDVSELVTGPPVLFEGIVMYSTFRPVTGGPSANACDEGYGALYAVDYLGHGTTPNVGTPATPSPLPFDMGTGSDFNLRFIDTDSPGLLGKLVMGLSVVQKPSCEATATISSINPPGFSNPAAVASGNPTFEVVGNTAKGLDQSSTSDIGQVRRQFTVFPRSRVVSWAGPSD